MVSAILGVSATHYSGTPASHSCARTNVEQVVAQAPPPANGEGHVPPAHGR